MELTRRVQSLIPSRGIRMAKVLKGPCPCECCQAWRWHTKRIQDIVRAATLPLGSQMEELQKLVVTVPMRQDEDISSPLNDWIN
jgi:hypothetical protein